MADHVVEKPVAVARQLVLLEFAVVPCAVLQPAARALLALDDTHRVADRGRRPCGECLARAVEAIVLEDDRRGGLPKGDERLHVEAEGREHADDVARQCSHHERGSGRKLHALLHAAHVVASLGRERSSAEHGPRVIGQAHGTALGCAQPMQCWLELDGLDGPPAP